MAYSFGGRIRYSELGENGLLTLPGVLDYFQDCATFQSEDVGLGFADLRARNRFWVLGAWQVVVNRYPALGEEIVTATLPYEFRGFMGMRNFTMDTVQGERLAYANSFWIYLDTETGKPAKLLDEDTVPYGIDQKLDMDYAPRKIALPEQLNKEEPFAVQKHHLDTNHHVNNCQYVRMAMDYLPAGFKIRQMRAEYKQQAHLHDIICPRTGSRNRISGDLAESAAAAANINGAPASIDRSAVNAAGISGEGAAAGTPPGSEKITVLLNDSFGAPYAVVEFEGK